jgi:hypothetical protein
MVNLAGAAVSAIGGFLVVVVVVRTVNGAEVGAFLDTTSVFLISPPRPPRPRRRTFARTSTTSFGRGPATTSTAKTTTSQPNPQIALSTC